MQQSQIKDKIRASLKQKLFTEKKFQFVKQDSRNPSPPTNTTTIIQDDTQEFRHFEDVYFINENDSYVGEGAHGIVRRCYKIQNQQSPLKRSLTKSLYAVKIFRSGDPEIVNTIRQTFQLNRSLNDIPFVIKAYDLFINAQKEQIHLVMEYCPYKSLENAMENQIITDQKVKQIALQLAQAIEILHQRGVSHRDIKPDNILVAMNNDKVELKLIDFGVSKRFLHKVKSQTKNIDMWTRTGTLFYQAPEIFTGGGYNEKVDIWAAGIIMYQLMCGTLPFQFETILETIEQICDSDFNVENTTNFEFLNSLQQDLLKRLLKKDPEKRLSATDFSLHPWLHTKSNKKQNKSFDDSDIAQFREIGIIDCSLSTQLQIRQSHTIQSRESKQDQHDLKVIQETDDNVGDSRKNSWINYWDNHIHVVPEQGGHFNSFNKFSLNLAQFANDDDKVKENIGSSIELPQSQHEQAINNNNNNNNNNHNTHNKGEFNILSKLQRTESIQFDYVE